MQRQLSIHQQEEVMKTQEKYRKDAEDMRKTCEKEMPRPDKRWNEERIKMEQKLAKETKSRGKKMRQLKSSKAKPSQSNLFSSLRKRS